MVSLGTKIRYTCTGPGFTPPLTLMACEPNWEDYLDFGESLHEMVKCLLEEKDAQGSPAKESTAIEEGDTTQIIALPPNDNTVMLSSESLIAHPECAQMHHGHSATDPVMLSDAPTDSSIPRDPHPDTRDNQDDAKILGHYCDALDEMVQSLMDLEDGYLKALREVIHHTERALCDILHIDSHYISHIITVMASWQEAVQATASHMETTDSALYFMHWEDLH